MNTVTIREKEGQLYKREEWVDPGEYLLLPSKPSDDIKKKLPCHPITYRGRFYWTVQCLPWVKRLLDNSIIRYETDVDVAALYDQLSQLNLRKWQDKWLRKSINALMNHEDWKRGLIAPLGAGKTTPALALCSLGPSVYVCPKHLKTTGTIQDEINRLERLGFYIDPQPIITTPESAKKLLDQQFTTVIIDEVLSVKNPEALRSRAMKKLCEDTPIVIGMTGTPMSAKKGMDVFGWLSIVNFDCVPGTEKHCKWNFGVNPRYQSLREKGIDRDGSPLVVDGWDKDKMLKFASPYLDIIPESEAIEGLPELTYQKLYLPTPRAFRPIVLGALTTKGKSKSVIQARTCTDGFIYQDDQEVQVFPENPKLDWVKEFIESNPDEPLAIFAAWNGTLKIFEEGLKEYNPVVVSSDSKESLGRWLDGDTNILLISSNLTEGMNLQKGRIEIVVSSPTSPKARQQMEKRQHRPGQTRNCVIYDLLCEGTLDERQLDLLMTYKNENEGFIQKGLELELEKLIKKGEV